MHIMLSDAPATRIGQLLLAGEIIDAEPVMPLSLRVMSAYVLSVVTDGHGSYRHVDGRTQPIGPGTLTLVHPNQPHWYGTAPGQHWTELFAVFAGPLFDTLATVGVLPDTGPQKPPSIPPTTMLRAALRATPRHDHNLQPNTNCWLWPTGSSTPTSPLVSRAAALPSRPPWGCSPTI